MKRSTKLALSLVLAVGAAAPAFAQDNFPDVPANHWAYEALARMKRDGLLVGYPDGLYRGGRPASRYELAVAMHAVYTNLKNITDGLDAQIRAMQAPNPDIQALKDAVAALQSDVAALKGYGDDIAALKRAAEVFDRELKSLGVDVEAMKKDLGDLAGRVRALENKKPPIEVSGDVNLLILAGNSQGDTPGLSMDGRTYGINNVGGTAGLTDDLNILHEAAFTVTGTNATGVKFTGTGVIGNMLSATDGTGINNSFGSQSTLPAGRYSDGVASDIYLQNLEVSLGSSVLGKHLDVVAGRLNIKADPWSFQRPDTTSYYSNERWDNGKYTMDGASVGFKLFGAKIGAFGGRNSERFSVNGVDVNQVVLGNNRVAGNPTTVLDTSDETINAPGALSANDVDRTLGLTINTPLTRVGNLNLSYLWLDSDNNIPGVVGTDLFGIAGANRVEVYGGNADFTFGRFKVGGSYHKSDINSNSSSLVDDDNDAFDASVGYKGNRFDVYGKYREVGVNYVAPGDWGRLGILRNPANIRGFQFGGSLNINNLLVLSGGGEISTGLNDGSAISGVGSPFDGDTEINSYSVRLDYKLNPNVSLYGAFEDTRFAGLANGAAGNGVAKYRFATVGLGYGLSESAKINLSYQYSDVKNESFLGAGAFTTLVATTRAVF